MDRFPVKSGIPIPPRHRTTSRGRHRRKDRGDRGRRGRDRPKPEVVVRAAGAHTAGLLVRACARVR